jgi:hypothetical protein
VSGLTGDYLPSNRRRNDMALYFTNTIRIKPGHLEQYLASAAKTIPIFEKYGVKFLGAFQAVGGEGNSAVYLVSVPDFAAWGDLLQKMQGDAEFMAVQRAGGNHIDGSTLQALAPMPGSAMQ